MEINQHCKAKQKAEVQLSISIAKHKAKQKAELKEMVWLKSSRSEVTANKETMTEKNPSQMEKAPTPAKDERMEDRRTMQKNPFFISLILWMGFFVLTWMALSEESIYRLHKREGDWTAKAFPGILLGSLFGVGLVEVCGSHFHLISQIKQLKGWDGRDDGAGPSGTMGWGGIRLRLAPPIGHGVDGARSDRWPSLLSMECDR